MTINASDIKLIESEVMTDATDGGGRRTTRVIPDGVAGNIFPKVSRLDTVYGRLNLRKIYGQVDSENVDTYAGAHAIITDPPTNAKIGVVLFSTKNDFDRRSSARDRIESYVVSGPESRLRLYGRQPVGAKAVLCHQRETDPLPDIGDVYALVQENTAGTMLFTQYIRVQTVESSVQEFEDDRGIYRFNVVVVGISSPLEYEFFGPDTPARGSNVQRLGKVRLTSVADAARYYGIQPISKPITAGDLTVKLPSIHAALVPTTQREVPISLAAIAGATGYIAAGGSFTYSDAFGSKYYFPGSVLPGSVLFSGGWPYPVTDDGEGALHAAAGSSGYSGTVDYGSGLTLMTPNFPQAGAATATASHGVAVSQPSHTAADEITLATRGSVYSKVVSPAPAPGTTIVDFRALGKWYRLRDEAGDGTLVGFSAAVGTGTVDYVTGAIVVSLGSLPDVDSSVLYAWGSETHYRQRTGADAAVSAKLLQRIQLTKTPVKTNSATLKVVDRTGALFTVQLNTSNAYTSNGFIKHASLNPVTGVMMVEYSQLPMQGSTVRVAYDFLDEASGSTAPVTKSETFSVGGQTTLSLSEEISPGSVRVILPVSSQPGYHPTTGARMPESFGDILCLDNGSGALVVADGQKIAGNYGGDRTAAAVTAGTIVGIINYSTGTIGISNNIPFIAPGWVYPLGTRPGRWEDVAMVATRVPYAGAAARPCVVTYRPASATTIDSGHEDELSFAQAPFVFNITENVPDSVVPGSVSFNLGDSTTPHQFNVYTDRNGVIVGLVGPTTGAATTFGSIDYDSGEIRLTDWALNFNTIVSNRINLMSCLTRKGAFSTDRVHFRTSGSPLRPSSLFVQATSIDGEVISATSDVNGVISGTLITGVANQTMGTVSLRFGEWKPVSGNTSADWYNADNVDPSDTSRVWKPTLVLPDTFRYSAVVTANVSLDSTILGVDPVRLPLDGRIPMVRPADVAVIHNTQEYTLANPAVAGHTYSVGRTGLTDLWLVDDKGVRVSFDLYTVDLDNGTVTMASPLNLTGIEQPLRAKHRISDMVMVADALINGQVDVASEITHNYPVDGTYFSTALLFGDLYARVSNLFDQATWLGKWADELEGSESTSEYNNILYPIEVVNNGAVTERWRLSFTSSTVFQCIGENAGLIATGTIGQHFGPINPLTGEPYFVIRLGGWGSGWSVGNQLRFNTYAASAPIWLARTILPGASLTGDSIDIQLRGDVDA